MYCITNTKMKNFKIKIELRHLSGESVNLQKQLFLKKLENQLCSETLMLFFLHGFNSFYIVKFESIAKGE